MTAALAWVRAQLGPRPMPALAVIIGAGDSAGALEAVESLRPDVRVLVLEPDPAAAARVSADPASQRRTAERRLRCLAGPGYIGADDAWRLVPDDPDDHVVLLSPAAAAARAESIEAVRVFRRILYGARANATARQRFAPRYLTNSLANLGAIARGSKVEGVAQAFAGHAAVVVGAGPSLDDVLPTLVDLAPHAVIITTDTALRPLRHAGLKPHIVVGADPSEKNARHFFGLPPSDDTWLVAESALDPRAADAFADRTSWFRVASHEPWPWFQTLGVDTTPLEMWGSVLTAAYQTAMLAGCDPIVFVGADLAFTHGRPYARGTTYEFDWAYTATLGANLDEAWRQQMAMAPRTTTPGIDGQPVDTTNPLEAFRDWLVAQAGRSGRRVVNATGGGILHGAGIAQASLADVLRDRAPVPRMRRPDRPTTEVPYDRLSAQVSTLRAEIARGDRTTPLLARWATFTGAPLALPELDAALADAQRTLDAGQAGDRRSWVPWPALADAGYALARLSQLPEDIRDTSTAAGPTPEAIAPGALLMAVTCDALATTTVDDRAEAGTSEGQDARRLPWPDAVAWPLRTLDSLVPPNLAVPPSNYFDRAVPHHSDADAAPRAPAIRLADELAARWMRAAAGHAGRDTGSRLLGYARLVEQHPGFADSSALPTQALAVCVTGPADFERRVTRVVSRRVAARLLTGCLRTGTRDASRSRLAVSAHGPVTVSIDVEQVSAVLTPRVLTDDGMAPAAGAAMSEGGVVVVPLHHDHSIWIGEDGTTRRHLTWPAPIVGELPMGDGAVAWSNGTASMPDLSDGYVLYRPTRESAVIREVLPFRPTAGAWFDGRLHWNTFRTGLGVWAPGLSPQWTLDAESFCGVSVDGDGVHLAPATRNADGAVVRRLHTDGWRLDPGGSVVREALPPEGACPSAAAGTAWTARAYPDVDLVRLDAGSRRIDLVCHHPMSVAWAGRSLVVCSAAGEVLLFERLTDVLDALT